MGKINNYQTDTPNPGDKILASDDSTGATKNITAQSVADLGRSSKVYRAFLTQTGVTAPVATVVPGNTITGYWEYNDVGEYAFVSTSTTTFQNVEAAMIVGVSGAQDNTYEFSLISNIAALFKTYSAGVIADDLLNGLYVEIFTYDI